MKNRYLQMNYFVVEYIKISVEKSMKYEVIYSKRKTIALTVKDLKLIVRAPKGTGKDKIENLILDHSAWIEKAMHRSKQKMALDNISSDEEAKLRKLAKQVLKAKTAYYSKIMGLKFGRITITGAKTRFGSCSSKGNISFSFRLMLYPDAAIDYVVVHELAHLVELNHSPKFWKIVENIFPDYKARRKMLKGI